MSTPPSEEKVAVNPNEPAAKRTDLAYERTRFAADRTLMAWIRTSLSMISFGFTIFKFFQYLQESKSFELVKGHHGARNLGMLMTLLGTCLLIPATVEYLLFLRRISKEAHQKFPVSTALLAAFLLSILGLLAIMNLLFNIGPL
ncbi:MAG: DUF202 domain-containing protein [Candidatus Eremiobacteraeota bacterium]|nr:DUF202 domain-containing protein [Candidatus Eremiobacteraeota bacterium]